MLPIQVSAGDEPCMAGDDGAETETEQRRCCLVWPEMTVDSDTGRWQSALLVLSYIYTSYGGGFAARVSTAFVYINALA